MGIGYGKGLGPGTYDIHSPVVPPTDFIETKIRSFLGSVEISNLVINPDCGLKTRHGRRLLPPSRTWWRPPRRFVLRFRPRPKKEGESGLSIIETQQLAIKLNFFCCCLEK